MLTMASAGSTQINEVLKKQYIIRLMLYPKCTLSYDKLHLMVYLYIVYSTTFLVGKPRLFYSTVGGLSFSIEPKRSLIWVDKEC